MRPVLLVVKAVTSAEKLNCILATNSEAGRSQGVDQSHDHPLIIRSLKVEICGAKFNILSLGLAQAPRREFLSTPFRSMHDCSRRQIAGSEEKALETLGVTFNIYLIISKIYVWALSK